MLCRAHAFLRLAIENFSGVPDAFRIWTSWKEGEAAIADHFCRDTLQNLVRQVLQCFLIAVAMYIDEPGCDVKPVAIQDVPVQ